ncbi:MAG: hypothetical protein FVQ82_17690 [Planctomycetes bacterium]|nr:hypothetical protein [Planctomycetota bacterium]
MALAGSRRYFNGYFATEDKEEKREVREKQKKRKTKKEKNKKEKAKQINTIDSTNEGALLSLLIHRVYV